MRLKVGGAVDDLIIGAISGPVVPFTLLGKVASARPPGGGPVAVSSACSSTVRCCCCNALLTAMDAAPERAPSFAFDGPRGEETRWRPDNGLLELDDPAPRLEGTCFSGDLSREGCRAGDLSRSNRDPTGKSIDDELVETGVGRKSSLGGRGGRFGGPDARFGCCASIASGFVPLRYDLNICRWFAGSLRCPGRIGVSGGGSAGGGAVGGSKSLGGVARRSFFFVDDLFCILLLLSKDDTDFPLFNGLACSLAEDFLLRSKPCAAFLASISAVDNCVGGGGANIPPTRKFVEDC